MQKTKFKTIVAILAAALMLLMAACGDNSGSSGSGSSGSGSGSKGNSNSDYDTYAAAYNRVTANGGLDADIDVKLVMDGTTKTATGNFKVDNSDSEKTLLYLEVNMDGKTSTQFSDGEYLYTDSEGEKIMYKLGDKDSVPEKTKENTMEAPPEGESQEGTPGEEPSAPTGPNGETPPERGSEGSSGEQPQEPEPPEAPTFDASSFLSDFASFIEAGKIQEMGLLSALKSSYITSTTHEGNVYTLNVSEEVVAIYLNTLASNIIQDEGTLQVKNLENFVYQATIEGDYVTAVKYAGDLNIDVSAGISPTGEDESYSLSIEINIKFNNPGEKVDIALPSTDDYELASNKSN